MVLFMFGTSAQPYRAPKTPDHSELKDKEVTDLANLITGKKLEFGRAFLPEDLYGWTVSSFNLMANPMSSL